MHHASRRLIGLMVAGSVALAACGSSTGTSTSSSTTPSPQGTSSGVAHQVANVAYAGSLQLLNEQTVGPAFSKSTGFGYEGRGAGSFGLSHEIAAGEITPNVFESIGAAPITALEPTQTHWYISFAASPIVVAYNPHTPYAAELAKISQGKVPFAQLFSVMRSKGFLLGRTNPNTDPQGQAFYEMVELGVRREGLAPGVVQQVLGSVDNPSQVFSETSLEARLEAGQLDAASAFASQAKQLHLPYVALPAAINFGNPSLASEYASASVALSNGVTVHGAPLVVDVTVIGNQDSAAADAFVRYQLSAAGKREFAQAGYSVFSPIFVGTNIPKSIRDAG